MDLRTIADWSVRLRLLAVPGVADVTVFGGDTRSIQIQVHPDQLIRYDLTLNDVLTVGPPGDRRARRRFHRHQEVANRVPDRGTVPHGGRHRANRAAEPGSGERNAGQRCRRGRGARAADRRCRDPRQAGCDPQCVGTVRRQHCRGDEGRRGGAARAAAGPQADGIVLQADLVPPGELHQHRDEQRPGIADAGRRPGRSSFSSSSSSTCGRRRSRAPPFRCHSWPARSCSKASAPR